MTRKPRSHVRILIYIERSIERGLLGKVRKTESTLEGVWHSFTAGGSAHPTHTICCNFIAHVLNLLFASSVSKYR